MGKHIRTSFSPCCRGSISRLDLFLVWALMWLHWTRRFLECSWRSRGVLCVIHICHTRDQNTDSILRGHIDRQNWTVLALGIRPILARPGRHEISVLIAITDYVCAGAKWLLHPGDDVGGVQVRGGHGASHARRQQEPRGRPHRHERALLPEPRRFPRHRGDGAPRHKPHTVSSTPGWRQRLLSRCLLGHQIILRREEIFVKTSQFLLEESNCYRDRLT